MPRGSQGAARHFASEQTLHQNDGDQDRQNVFKVGLDPLRHFGAAAGVALGGVFVEAPAPFGDTEQQINKAAARQQNVADKALTVCTDLKLVTQRLKVLQDLGLGYLTLGEETPSLSGGEAQRLKLASEMGKAQHDTVFVFDEPTIGLHPLDVRTLLGVFRTLIENGATVIVIEHDLDVIRSADYLIDMGPGGGEEGGRVVACGTPAEVKRNPESRTGKFI